MYTTSPERFPGWRQVNDLQYRAPLHHELALLPYRYLQDIGISCRTADYRPSKLFWPL